MESPGTERHPLKPFLPQGARLLFLGSFPPKKERWSMDFFYPNFNNDMWRIFGLVFFGDRSHFVTPDGKHFDKASVEAFCRSRGIALFDTAVEVRRLKDNASDKFLEIVEPTDIGSLLGKLPDCRAVVATGQKAAETAAATFGCDVPSPGHYVTGTLSAGSGTGSAPVSAVSPGSPENKTVPAEYRLWRMPSSSRAYPLSIEKKAEYYSRLFTSEGLL